MARLFVDSLIKFLVVNSFEHHKSTVKAGGCMMFDWLITKGIIDREEQKVKGAIIQAQQALNINEISNASVINYAKALYVDSIFNELKASGISIREFLEGPITELNKT